MATLDVSELLDEDDFGDPFILIQRTSSVNDKGVNAVAEVPGDAFGSIQPAGGLLRTLFPEAARPQDWIKVYAPLSMRAASVTDPTVYADIVEFRGVRYVVRAVDDWMHFGAGYCRAVCQQENTQA